MSEIRNHAQRVILFADHTAKLGGGEIALLNMVTHFDPAFYKPVVVLASNGPLATRLKAQGIETHILPISSDIIETRKDSIGFRTLLGGKVLKQCIMYSVRLAWFAKVRRVDLIHTNSLKSDIYGGLAGRLSGIPVLWHVRDHIDSQYLPWGVAAAFRWLARVLPQAVVTNSQSTRRRLRANRAAQVAVVHSGIVDQGFPLHMAVVHDGLNPKDYAATSKAGMPPLNGKAPIVVLVGRIAEWKGQHIFLKAASLVLKKYPEARFQIVGAPLFGEEDYERSLQTLTRELHIEDNIDFLGFREDVSDLLAQADIVVHASTLGEPFGQVVIEGMAAGKPVIATDGGALPEIIESGRTGLLVPMGAAPAMAEAISSILENPAKGVAMGQEGRQRVLERFTIMHTVKKMQVIYERMLSGRQSHPHFASGSHRDFGQLTLSSPEAVGLPGQLALSGTDAVQEGKRAVITGKAGDATDTRGNL